MLNKKFDEHDERDVPDWVYYAVYAVGALFSICFSLGMSYGLFLLFIEISGI